MSVQMERIDAALKDFEKTQPLPDSLPPVPSFELELLPSVLSVSASRISEAKQAPVDFVAVTYMVSLSSLLARNIAIRPMHDWTVVPNLWGVDIGRPSAKKSPAMSAALKPLESIEDNAAELFDSEAKDFAACRQLYEHQVKANTGKIQKAVKDGNTYKAESLIAQQADDEPLEPTCTRYLANDTTVEKLADLLTQNPSMLVCRDELAGFFASLERHGQEGARSFYLESWNGDKSFKVDRIARGSTRVPRACVSVLGSIQPGPLSGLLREAARHNRSNDGLMQRFQLAVWPDLSPRFQLIDVEADSVNDREITELFSRFASLDPATVGAEIPESGLPFLKFAPDAQKVFCKWLEGHENRLRNDDMPECLEAHLGKYPSMVPSLALILHLAEGHHGPVNALSTQKAIAWAVYLEKHAKRIYAPISGADYVAARALASKLKAKKVICGSTKRTDRFSLRDVYRNGWANLSTDECRLAVDVLEDFNWVSRGLEPTDGRTATVYHINPLIWEGDL